jgi:hypothetical protein
VTVGGVIYDIGEKPFIIDLSKEEDQGEEKRKKS